jgi:hypothetical protein
MAGQQGSLMHVYLKDEPVELEMREVDAEGLADEETGLVPVAFFVHGNRNPSFRALLPPETLVVLGEATQKPVKLGLLAEEPDDPGSEVRAMVGLSLSPDEMPTTLAVDEDDDDGEEDDGAPAEPWRAHDPDAWKAGGPEGGDDDDARTILLAFAPLVRLARKFPHDFSEELADLLETALAGDTRPNLQARIDRMLGDL